MFLESEQENSLISISGYDIPWTTFILVSSESVFNFILDFFLFYIA